MCNPDIIRVVLVLCDCCNRKQLLKIAVFEIICLAVVYYFTLWY